jgi:transposase
MAAKARGVQFCKPAPKVETVETKVRLCRQLMAEGKSSVEAAEAVNWSKATMYRYVKQFGTDGPLTGPVKTRRGTSKYAGQRHEPALRN